MGVVPFEIHSGLQKQRIQQPWDMHSEEGFTVPVCLKPSSIPGAGTGRFTVTPVAEGTVVRAEPIKSVAEFISAGGVAAAFCWLLLLPPATPDVPLASSRWKFGKQ